MLAAIARTARMAATSAPTASPHQVAFGGVSPMPSTSRISHPGGIARPRPIPESRMTRYDFQNNAVVAGPLFRFSDRF